MVSAKRAFKITRSHTSLSRERYATVTNAVKGKESQASFYRAQSNKNNTETKHENHRRRKKQPAHKRERGEEKSCKLKL